MNILILNWRDWKNPSSGGAEILSYEIAKRFVKKGHKVIWFTSSYKTAKKKEIISGIQIIRKGRWWNVHIYAFFYYVFFLRRKVDVVIDEVHWFPFFVKLYTRKKVILLACEIAHNLFYEIFPKPIAGLWNLLERIYLYIYKNTPTMVISESTKADFLRHGYKNQKICLLPMGLTLPKNMSIYSKESIPTIMYLGRMNKQKGIIDAIHAFSLVKKSVPSAIFWIAGSGTNQYVALVKERIRKYKLTKSVKFYGFVSEEKKFELLSKTHILVVPSHHEGWGLIVPEAGRVKTPSVVYDVAGLRDIVKNNKSGKVVQKDSLSLANGVIDLLENKKLYSLIQKNIYNQSKKYDWNNTAEKALNFINKI